MANMLDAGSVSVPFESLKRVTRERKYTVDEVEAVVKGVAKAAGGGGAPSADAAAAQLEQYEQQLQGLKRKVGLVWVLGGQAGRGRVARTSRVAGPPDWGSVDCRPLPPHHRAPALLVPLFALPPSPAVCSWRSQARPRPTTWPAAACGCSTCARWARRRAPPARWSGTDGASTACWWTTC